MSDDVAIVGGGIAGLAAARVLADHGVGVEIYEASDHLGGRVQTIYEREGIVELGPELVHGRPAATLALARDANIELDEIPDRHHVRRGGQLEPVDDIWRRFAGMIDGARGTRPDESARVYLDRAALSMDDAKLFALLVEGFYAAPLGDISIASIVADTSVDAGPQYRVRGGYGQLVDWLVGQLLRSRVAIHHNCFVYAIDWTHDRVQLDYRRNDTDSSAATRRVIVTLPIGVLQSGAVQFWPGLGDHATAIDRLAMGQVVKLVLCMRSPIWRDFAPRDLEFVHARDGVFPSFWVHSAGESHQLTAWAGGPHARSLAGCEEEVLVALAIDDFAMALGMPRSALATAVRHHHVHAYGADSRARGAYSYTRVGGLGAASVLSRPLRDRVFFAGEATSSEDEGTVAGALASGARAANQVLRLTRSA